MAVAVAVLLFGQWFAGRQAGAATGDVQFFQLPRGGTPSDVTSAGGLAYFTLAGAGLDLIATFDAQQRYNEFVPPTPEPGLLGITVGPDGSTVWFVESRANNVGALDTNTETIAEFPIPTAGSHPVDIAPGPDGNVWFTEQAAHQIGQVTTAGTIVEFAVPLVDGNTVAGSPNQIAAGADGSMWFTMPEANLIGRITMDGAVTQFPVPTADSGPLGITGGPDGNVWFTESNANKIARISPAGAVTEFALPPDASQPPSQPTGITPVPDGNLWFTETGSDKIGRITPDGTITEFDLPHDFSGRHQPTNITVGPDGNVWFASLEGIDVMEVGPAPTTTSTSTSTTTTLPPTTTTSTSTSSTVPSAPDQCKVIREARERVNAALDAFQRAFGGMLGGSVEGVRAAVNAQLDQALSLACPPGPVAGVAEAQPPAGAAPPLPGNDQPGPGEGSSRGAAAPSAGIEPGDTEASS